MVQKELNIGFKDQERIHASNQAGVRLRLCGNPCIALARPVPRAGADSPDSTS
jgi:hypothetical protein